MTVKDAAFLAIGPYSLPSHGARQVIARLAKNAAA